jgi:hypothetical protein
MNFIQYIKQAWKAGTSGGTPLSPDRLNHMEDGIKNNNSMISELNSNNITNNICTNLLNPTLKTSSQNGITCTNNGDGTYTLNGTASDNAVFILQSNIEIASGKYKLTGCPQGGSTTSFKLDFEYKGNSTGIDYGNGSIINKTSNDIFKYLRIVIYTGTILNNAVFKPMLTTNLSATYDDFVSYTGNTGRLNADVALLRNNLNNAINKYFINTNETIYIPLNTMLLIYETAFDMGAYVVRRETKDRMFIHALKENSKVSIELANTGNLKITNTASVGGDILTIIY